MGLSLPVRWGLLAALALALGAGGCLGPRLLTPGGVPAGREWIIAEELSGRGLDPIEGLWAWEGEELELAIVRNRTDLAPGYEYLGIVTRSRDLLTRVGEMKLAMNASASPMAFPGICRCPGGWVGEGRMGTTFLLAGGDFLSFSYELYPDQMNYRLVRIFPKPGGPAMAMGTAGALPAPGGSGSGFLVSPDLVATALHVVEGARQLHAYQEGRRRQARLWLADRERDLAVLQLGRALPESEGPPPPAARCLRLRSGQAPLAGERTFALGFPLGGLLGSAPHISEGIVTNTTGVGGEPRTFQMSNPIQPGQSGGPLLDERGEVIGLITSSLRANLAGPLGPLLPQNANFAAGAASLETLLGGAADPSCAPPPASGAGPLPASEIARLAAPAIVRLQAQ